MSAQPDLAERLKEEDRVYKAALKAAERTHEEVDAETPATGA